MREYDRIQKLPQIKTELTQQDLEYDSDSEARLIKKYPRDWQRFHEERKRIREKEKQDDAADKKNEEDEIADLQKKKLQELKILEEKKKREEENRERMKLKRFMEMQEEFE